MAVYNNYPYYQPVYPTRYQPLQGTQMSLSNQQQYNTPTNISTPPNQQIQSGGFIPIPSEAHARNYPVAPGNSVTFKDEFKPYVYTKTQGFNQMELPAFKKYKLIEELDASIAPGDSVLEEPVKYVEQDTFDALKDELETYKENYLTLEEDVEDLRKKITDFFSKKPEDKKK